jgi:hypothetical protein
MLAGCVIETELGINLTPPPAHPFRYSQCQRAFFREQYLFRIDRTRHLFPETSVPRDVLPWRGGSL